MKKQPGRASRNPTLYIESSNLRYVGFHCVQPNLPLVTAKNMRLLNEIPEFLYRAFSREKYARDFIERGHIRIGSIAFYRRIEDEKRRDITDGVGHIKVRELIKSLLITGPKIEENIKPGNLDVETENLNCKYLLCCSDPEVDIALLKKCFGKYIVKIAEPRRLSDDICNYLEEKHIAFIDSPKWIKVNYRKGLLIDKMPSNNQLAEISYSQKDARFAEDHECRLVIIMPQAVSECRKFLMVNLGQRLDYVVPVGWA